LITAFFTLKCEIWAHNIKKDIEIDPNMIKSVYHIPAINNVEEDILRAPTIFLSKLEYPNSLNSISTLSYLNVQTINTDTDTII
jgi:hypothetical protein